MSIAIFDFHNTKKRRLFWLVVFICFFLSVMSSMLLFSIYQKDKEIEAQIRAANEASIFIAPPDILDPKTIFNDLVAYEDTPAIKEATLPDPVAPEKILDPNWAMNFIKPTLELK